MTVRGLAERTQECYAEAVSRMARHYRRSPDLLSPANAVGLLALIRAPQSQVQIQ
jgi:hypothetical protein